MKNSGQFLAEIDKRHFAVLDVGDDHMQDHAYFMAIDDELNNGGREALLDLLLKFDLTKVNLREIPKTSALLEQKIESLSGTQNWWLDTMIGGVLPAGCGARCCPADALIEKYAAHASRSGIRRREGASQLGLFLSKHVPGLVKRKGQRKDGTRGVVYEFPPLAECRSAFESLIQQKIDWPEQGDWQIEGCDGAEDEFTRVPDAVRSPDDLFTPPSAEADASQMQTRPWFDLDDPEHDIAKPNRPAKSTGHAPNTDTAVSPTRARPWFDLDDLEDDTAKRSRQVVRPHRASIAATAAQPQQDRPWLD